MSQNVLEEFKEQKRQLAVLIQKAAEFKWISHDQANEMSDKLEKDELTIGVIGQMKCGKSTFLNAFVFGDDVLPSATTPMTASLALITYGEQEKITAEFYTYDEWAEQQRTASLPLEGCNELEQSKRKAARELVEKSSKLGGRLNSLLGKTQDDKLSSLEEYVGADGTYISITKSVKIYYPKEYLKNVKIVDTPGMNDPIVSREERTREFLERADVVLMMLYAGRPFDSTDHNILFNDVRKCGMGKVLIGINKYDIPWMNGETEDEIKAYVKDQLNSACKQCNDDTILDILKEVEPIPLSANMALLSELPMSRITSDDKYSFEWQRYCDTFEISTQSQFRQKSHLDDLGTAVMNLIINEKGKVLLAKPRNEIMAAGIAKLEETEKQCKDCINEIKILQTPDSELDDKLDNIERAERKLNKRLNQLNDSFEGVLNEKWPDIKREMQNNFDTICNSMRRKVDKWTKGSLEQLRDDLDNASIGLKRAISGTLGKVLGNGEIKKGMRSEVDDFFDKASSYAQRYLENLAENDFLNTIKGKIQMQIEDKEYNDLDNLFDKDGALWSSVKNEFFKKSKKEEILNGITNFKKSFNFDIYKSVIESEMKRIADLIQTDCIDEIIKPLRSQIEDCKNKKDDREAKLKDAKERIAGLEADKHTIEEQLAQIKNVI